MFFFNGRIRSAHVVPVITHDQPYTHKIGHSCIITTCLSLIIGLVLIVVGVISETKKTTFIGIGIITLGVSFFLTTTACFYAQLKICYRNWAYGPPVVPVNIEHTQTTKTRAMPTIRFAETPTILNDTMYDCSMTSNTCITTVGSRNK